MSEQSVHTGNRLEHLVEARAVPSTGVFKVYYALPPTEQSPKARYVEREIPKNLIGPGIEGVFIDDSLTLPMAPFFREEQKDIHGYHLVLPGGTNNQGHRIGIYSSELIPLDPDQENIAPTVQKFYDRFSNALETLCPIPVFTTGQPEYWQVLQETMTSKTRLIRQSTTQARATTRRYKRLAFHDDNTELPNRRAYQDNMVKNARRASEFGSMLNVGAGDGIGFKAINDRYGQQEGDQVIKQLGQILRKSLRPEDQLYRIGGDEFRFVTFGGDPQKLKQRLESIVPESPIKVTDAAGVERVVYLRGIDIAFASSDGTKYSSNLADSELEDIFKRLDKKADRDMHAIKDARNTAKARHV